MMVARQLAAGTRRAVLACALLAGLSGCASVTSGTTQDVLVESTPQGAECKASNGKGEWTVPRTPGTINVTKANGDLNISCTDQAGGAGSLAVKSRVHGAVFGNIAVGGLIGAAVDMGTGAAFRYPKQVTVSMTPGNSAPPLANATPIPVAPLPTPIQPASVTSTAPTPPASRGNQQMLDLLDDLRRRGVITEREYSVKRRAILEGP